MRRMLEELAERDDVCPATAERLREAAEQVPRDLPVSELLYHLAYTAKRMYGAAGPAPTIMAARGRQAAHERGDCIACVDRNH